MKNHQKLIFGKGNLRVGSGKPDSLDTLYIFKTDRSLDVGHGCDWTETDEKELVLELVFGSVASLDVLLNGLINVRAFMERSEEVRLGV